VLVVLFGPARLSRVWRDLPFCIGKGFAGGVGSSLSVIVERRAISQTSTSSQEKNFDFIGVDGAVSRGQLKIDEYQASIYSFQLLEELCRRRCEWTGTFLCCYFAERPFQGGVDSN
jgi:hypothetical protein